MPSKKLAALLTGAFLTALTGGAAAQVTDFSTTVTGPEDLVVSGDVGSFEITVSNAGPDASPFQVILDINFPLDAPFPYLDYLLADEAGRTAMIDAFLAGVTIDQNIWDDATSGIFMGTDSYCNGVYLQYQALTVGAGDGGKVYYDTTLPEVGVSGFAYVTSDDEKIVLDDHIGLGACSSTFDDCYVENVGITCMGPRVTMFATDGAPITPVDDGSANPTEGCTGGYAFPAGHVALIDRGTCAFQTKVTNAADAGASAVVIANYVGGGDWGNDGVGGLACDNDATCNELLITAPVVFISYNDGLGLKAAMETGEVTGFVGVRQESPNFAETRALVWEWDSDAGAPADETDSNPDNDRATLRSLFNGLIFADGFEDGTTTQWSNVQP